MLTINVIVPNNGIFVHGGHHCSSLEYIPKCLYTQLVLIGQILYLSSQVVFSIEMTFAVHSSSHGLIFVYIREPQMDIQCTQEFSGYSVVSQEYKIHSCVISSDFVCVHKSTYWNVVNARVHTQFYCVSCGGIDNLIWIFSLHFDIR